MSRKEPPASKDSVSVPAPGAFYEDAPGGIDPRAVHLARAALRERGAAIRKHQSEHGKPEQTEMVDHLIFETDLDVEACKRIIDINAEDLARAAARRFPFVVK